MAESVTIRVQRGNTSGPDHYDDFSVPVEPHTTVLDALEQIRTTQDPSLTYRHSCHHGSCGTCGMVINGEKKLACLTRPADMEGSIVEIRPLPMFEPVRDLAVDPARLFEHFPQDGDYLRESEFNREAKRPDELGSYQRFENCIECGLCENACPVVQLRPFMGPAGLAAYNREIEKHPERESELLETVNADAGAWGCDRALACSAVCPMGVYPAKHIAILQRRIKKQQSS